MPPARRAEVLWRLGDLIDENEEELSRLETIDQGQPLSIARAFSVRGAAQHFRYYAGWCTKLDGRVPQVSRTDAMLFTQRIPVGVCALITPWNFPLMIAAWKLAPALAAGNTVLLKPAEQTPLTSLRLAELASEAGIPDGVVNVVCGGPEVGEALTLHPRIDKVSFTGSTEVGQKIVRAAAGNLKRVSLELGGKAPAIVCADADLDRAVRMSVQSMTTNSGQVCGALSRFFVHESLVTEFERRAAEAIQQIVVGPGLASGTQMGPLNSEEHRNRVLAMVDRAQTEGAVLSAKGRVPVSEGNYMPPQILTAVNPEMEIAKEEIFGPVMPVIPYRDLDDAIRWVNNSDYGLAATVFTERLSTGHDLARRIDAGSVRVNTLSGLDPAAPWGGIKMSGWGREMGEEALDAYTEVKATWIGLDS